VNKIVRWAIIGLSFVWLAFVYASFYLVQQQRPFDAANARAVISMLLDVLSALALLLVGAALGHRFCRWMGVRLDRGVESVVLSCGMGLGGVSFLVLGLGLLGGLARWAIMAVFGALALLLLPDLAAIGRAVGELRKVALPPRGVRVYLMVMLLLTLLMALAPPIDWDGLFYHLTFPRLYIEQGRIGAIGDVPHQYFPGLVEMLYVAAMSIKGDVAAKLLHFGYMLLLGGVVYLMARRHVGQEYAWPALLAYASMPMVGVLGSWAYNDLALGYYQTAALYSLLNWFEEREQGSNARSWLVAAAAFCGLAMGVKYTAFVCFLAIALLAIGHLVRHRARWGEGLRALALLGGVALLAAAPWYLRNLAFTGNPVYPFAYRLFGGLGWSQWRADWYARAGTGIGMNLGQWIKLPWTLTLGLRDMNFYDGRIGPLFLVALPFLLAWGAGLLGPRSRALCSMAVFAAIQYGFWGIGVIHSRSLFQSRLLLPALVALCPLLAVLWERLRMLDTRLFSLRRLIGMSVALVLAANLCYQFLGTLRARPLPVLVGAESRDEFLTRNLGAHYRAMQMVNERVPEEGRVLFLWEPRSYYCRRSAQPDAILERWAWLLTQHEHRVEAVAGALVDEGYTHVLLHRSGMEFMRRTGLDPLDDADWAALESFISTYLSQEAAVDDAYDLYAIRVPLSRADAGRGRDV
jgi:hypothetical protein